MIPEFLEQETFLLEYLPGTYGDYVSGIVSYSVDGFLDPCEAHLSDGEEKYWNANNAIVARNKFPLSLRGGGHEHVLDYSEFMLAHHTFLHFNSFLHIPSPEKYKLLFNTHTYIVDPLRLRTMHNAFTDTKTNCLTIKDDFDIVFTSTCNEYFTSHKDKNEINWDDFRTMFIQRVKMIRHISKTVPKDQIIQIDNIQEFNPDLISCYGNVDQQKFEEYAKEYNDLKLSLLLHLARRTYKIFFKNNADRRKQYEQYYDATYT